MEEQGIFYDVFGTDKKEWDAEKWRERGRRAMARRHLGKRAVSERDWFLGDWLLLGKQQFKGRLREEAKKVTDIPWGTLKGFMGLAKEFPKSRRRDDLSWSHHREVWKLPKAEQDKKLDGCVITGKNGQTYIKPLSELKAEIRGTAKAKNEWDELQAGIERTKKGTELPETFKITFDGKTSAALRHLLLFHGHEQKMEEFLRSLVICGLQSKSGWINESKAALKILREA